MFKKNKPILGLALIIFFVCTTKITLYGRAYEIVKDLNKEWLIYDASVGSYLPYEVKKETINPHAISFFVAVEKNKYFDLQLSLEHNSALLVNDQLIKIYKRGDYFLKMDSLYQAYKQDSLFFTIYHTHIKATPPRTLIVNQNVIIEKNFINNTFAIDQRSNTYFQHFFVVGILMILTFVALMLYFQPKTIADYFKVNEALSMRNRDDPLYKSRVFSRPNLLMLLLYSLTASFLLIVFSHLLTEGYAVFDYFAHETFSQALFQWAKAFVFIALALILKHFLIYLFALLYKLFEFRNIHYYAYQRITMLIISIYLIVIVFAYLGMEEKSPQFYGGLIYFLIILFIFRVTILFFKLMNSSSNRILFLFSYLCGTELMPLVVLIKIFL